MPTLLRLKYFVDIVKEGSFSSAARKNNVAQTSVSQQIKELEKEYNCQLLNRKEQPIKPTSAGIVLLKSAQRVINDIDWLNLNMTAYLKNDSKLNISYTTIMDVKILNDILLNVDFDSSKIQIQKIKMNQAVEEVLNEKSDFVISYDSVFCGQDKIKTIPLKSGKYKIGVSKKHPLAKKKKVKISEVYQYPIVMINKNELGKSYDVMLERSQKIGLKPQIEYEVDNVDSEIFLIEQRNLIGFFPENYPESNLKYIPILDSPHCYQIVLAYKNTDENRIKANLIREIRFLNPKL